MQLILNTSEVIGSVFKILCVKGDWFEVCKILELKMCMVVQYVNDQMWNVPTTVIIHIEFSFILSPKVMVHITFNYPLRYIQTLKYQNSHYLNYKDNRMMCYFVLNAARPLYD